MVRGCVTFKGTFFMIESGFMCIDFNNFLHFPDLWVWFFLMQLLVSFFGISGFMVMTFRNLSGFIGGNLQFEWHSPVSWKLK